MDGRAAIVTGASSGIGLAIARMLAVEGFALTLAARRPGPLEAAAGDLGAAGFDVQAVAGDLGDEETVRRVAAAHRERHGRADVLVNGAGVGIGAYVGALEARKVDLQLATNLRSIFLMYRECLEMLKVPGGALVVNLASLTGKVGEPWLSVYSATKAGVVAFSRAMQRELAEHRIRSTALCPGYVDTPMTDFIKDRRPASEMIQTADVVEAVRFLLRLSPGCEVAEIVMERPGGGL
jgi:NAD(P)-dependent dehydrogenase (short-subunit alcohol dehydrogenase family)